VWNYKIKTQDLISLLKLSESVNNIDKSWAL